MVRIPVEYQEVEYIQGTINARIDTGIPGNNDSLVISGKVYFNKFSAYQGFFGNYIDEVHNTSRLILTSSANGAVIVDINRKAANSSVPNIGFYAGNVGEFKVSKTKLVFNGTEYSYGGVNNATANDTNILLNVANPALIESDSERYKRWYYFQINDGDTALRNYIPCYRKSDNKPGMYDTVSKQFFASSGTEEFIVGNDVSWDTASLIERRRQILLNTPHLTTESANPLTFQTDISANLKDCKIYFEPVQEGSGDPSPDNVRPITGWDGVTVTRTGKNLFDASSLTERLPWTIIPLNLKPGTYTMSTNKTYNNGLLAYFMYVNGPQGSTQNLYKGHNVTLTVTETKNVQFVYRRVSGTEVFSDYWYQIEQGSTATPYEPYTGTSLTLPFPQTIYGGYVDLVKGEVVEEWKKVELASQSWYMYTYSGNRIFTTDYLSPTPKYVHEGDAHIICDAYKTESARFSSRDFAIYGPDLSVSLSAANPSRSYALFNDTRATTKAEFAELVKNYSIAYKITTPIKHQLTPQIIKTLKGINNIWSDTNGNIEIKFWKH